ncbi:hypothetical protein, variant [Aphanomyces astaci]|uniref:Uncharacterized protein n=1 Tax=Aphanomyces astaci TaxID=112090 RepID=W4GCY9_APHAT|nr:hypothetical protein, variant [Aphanomyces astaci]ETV77540.1 hypothetical protein, variant [Aphanomyces astaci]|eukprot:XP_009832650.1 hypothetical protein, variant [Aphanomyces astaci]
MTISRRVFCTFCDCSCGNAPFSSAYKWPLEFTRDFRSRGHRCLLQCCAARSPCACNLVMRVAGSFTDLEIERFMCFSRVEDARSQGLDMGPVDSTALRAMVATTTLPRQEAHAIIPKPPLAECLFDVDVAAVASSLIVPSSSGTLYTFKSYLVMTEVEAQVVVGWAQSPLFTITSAPPLLPTLSLFALCECRCSYFSTDYIRMNKSCGRKELRCFPHCCPDHMPYNSCNVPLHIRLLSASADWTVLARVELATSTLAIGDVLSLDALQTDTNWILGAKMDYYVRVVLLCIYISRRWIILLVYTPNWFIHIYRTTTLKTEISTLFNRPIKSANAKS